MRDKKGRTLKVWYLIILDSSWQTFMFSLSIPAGVRIICGSFAPRDAEFAPRGEHDQKGVELSVNLREVSQFGESLVESPY